MFTIRPLMRQIRAFRYFEPGSAGPEGGVREVESASWVASESIARAEKNRLSSAWLPGGYLALRGYLEPVTNLLEGLVGDEGLEHSAR